MKYRAALDLGLILVPAEHFAWKFIVLIDPLSAGASAGMAL